MDWSLLMQLLQDGGWAANGSVSIQAGGSDALLPARYETHDRLLCQVSGRQRLLLLPPDQAWHGLYPYPVAHAYDRSSMVDWEEPELEHYPQAAQVSRAAACCKHRRHHVTQRCACVARWPLLLLLCVQVRGVLCDLSPGDSLVIPAYTTVHAQLMQPACVSLSLQLQPLPSRISSPPALVLQASRMVELWFAAEAGAANVRKWLQVCGACGGVPHAARGAPSGLGWLVWASCCAKPLWPMPGVCACASGLHMQALGEGREWQLLQPQTVKGYKLLRCCHAALEQLQRVLSLSLDASAAVPCSHSAVSCGGVLECAARRVLSSMTDGRLMPTHWLNEVCCVVVAVCQGAAAVQRLACQHAVSGRPALRRSSWAVSQYCQDAVTPCHCQDAVGLLALTCVTDCCRLQGIDDPLYLQHPSRYYLIEEDAEAVAFKCLFRRRLVDTSRPGWTGHAMELQLNAAVGGGQRSLVPVAAAPTGALTHSNSSAEEQV